MVHERHLHEHPGSRVLALSLSSIYSFLPLWSHIVLSWPPTPLTPSLLNHRWCLWLDSVLKIRVIILYGAGRRAIGGWRWGGARKQTSAHVKTVIWLWGWLLLPIPPVFAGQSSAGFPTNTAYWKTCTHIKQTPPTKVDIPSVSNAIQ